VKIYSITPDVNHYQSFQYDYPDTDPFWRSDRWTFDCTPKASGWVPPKVYILSPNLKRGNFFNLSPGGLVIDAEGINALRALLEMSGELLPVSYKGEEFAFLNVTSFVDALDQDRTNWVYAKGSGTKIRIEKYAFHSHRLPETPLFRIPETNKTVTFTIEGLKDPEDEFKFNVEQKGLKGLIFKEIWTDDK